jgi:squalene-associated FAD-dependent desaturase
MEKARIAYGMSCLIRQRTATPGASFLDWLLAHRQTKRTCDRYWGLILTSALNESLDQIDYRYARQVFVEGFLRNRESVVLEIPRVPLSELYGSALEGWLGRNNIVVRTNAPASGLEGGASGIQCVRTRDETLTADYYVLATPFQRVRELLPPAVAQDPFFTRLADLRSSPITSVHLWYDRPVLERPHLTPVGRTVQWLFRRNAAGNEKVEGHYIQAVISASRELSSIGKDLILERIAAEVAELLPAARSARLVQGRVVTERSATFSIVPGVDALRPTQQTPVPNLWLAGDYTQTGWPATMEGAVRAGYLAAQGILAACGRPEKVLQPALKTGRFAGLLLRDETDAAMMESPVAKN